VTGVPIPPDFVAMVGRAHAGINHVLLAMPTILNVPLSVLLRIEGKWTGNGQPGGVCLDSRITRRNMSWGMR
jgi:hypothetical protein